MSPGVSEGAVQSTVSGGLRESEVWVSPKGWALRVGCRSLVNVTWGVNYDHKEGAQNRILKGDSQ